MFSNQITQMTNLKFLNEYKKVKNFLKYINLQKKI